MRLSDSFETSNEAKKQKEMKASGSMNVEQAYHPGERRSRAPLKRNTPNAAGARQNSGRGRKKLPEDEESEIVDI